MGAPARNEQGRGARPGQDSDVRVAPVSFQVRDLLRDHGLVVGDTSGMVADEPDLQMDSDTWGILLPADTPKPRRLFGIPIPLSAKQPRRDFIGQIHMNTYSSDRHWNLKIYGRQNIERMQQLALEMSEKFGKRVIPILTQEEPDKERYLEDFYPL
jgi:hypothetical protein